jgi:hypothetical protein
LVAAEPICAMGTCEGFAALGLANGRVVLCSLSPLRELFSFEAHTAAVSVRLQPRRRQTQHATPIPPSNPIPPRRPPCNPHPTLQASTQQPPFHPACNPHPNPIPPRRPPVPADR